MVIVCNIIYLVHTPPPLHKHTHTDVALIPIKRNEEIRNENDTNQKVEIYSEGKTELERIADINPIDANQHKSLNHYQ